MQKKLKVVGGVLVACVALAVAPGTASAIQLRSGGTTVPAGTAIKGTAPSGVFIQTGLGILSCEGAELNGTATTPSGIEEGRIDVSGFRFIGSRPGEKCANEGFLGDTEWKFQGSACLHFSWIGSKGHWFYYGGTCGGVESVPQLLAVTSIGTCVYQGSPVFGSNLNSEPLNLFSEGSNSFKKVSGSNFCYSSFTLNIPQLQLKTGSGANLELHS